VRRLLLRSARTVALLVAFLGLDAGCGYSSKRLVDVPGVRTVAVLQFENDTYRRDLEFRLTGGSAEEVRADRLAHRHAGTADALLTGTIRARRSACSPRTRAPPHLEALPAGGGRPAPGSGDRAPAGRRLDHREPEFAEGYSARASDGSATDTVMQSPAQAVIGVRAADRRPTAFRSDLPPVRVR
jgi:hypothetical protein